MKARRSDGNSAVIGVNVELRTSKALTVYANYHAVADSHTVSQYVTGGFKVSW